MADVQIQTTRVAISTAAATNTQDITISGFGTPKAAIFILSGATTDDTLTAGGVLSIGYTDGTTSKAMGMHLEDNVGSTNTSSAYYNSCFVVPDVSGSGVDADFSFNSWITDGVRLTIDGQADAAWLLTVILIGGTDVSNVYVGEHDDLGSGTSAVDITSVGFEPDVVFMGSIATGTTASNAAAIAFQSFGIGINDVGETQRSITWSDYDAQSGAINAAVISNDSIIGGAGYSGITWEAAIGSYDTSGFSITPESSASFAIVHFLCLKFSNSPSIDLFDMTWPTSSNYAETTPGFQPTFGLIASMMGPSARNTSTNAGLYGFSLTAFDDTNIYTTSVSSEDGQNPTNANSMSADRLRILGDDGTDAVVASGYAFDADGWDFTLTTNPASSLLGFGLAIQGPTDTTAPILSSPTGTGTSATRASGSVSTDEGNGTLYYLSYTTSEPSDASVVSDGYSQAVSGTGVQNVTAVSVEPGVENFIKYVHTDAEGNQSTGVSSAGFTTDAAWTGTTDTSTYDGTALTDASAWWIVDGFHGGANNASTVTDTGAFTGLTLNDNRVVNDIDGCTGIISSHTNDVLTPASLTGGTQNDFDIGEAYHVEFDIANTDVCYYRPTITISSDSGTFPMYFKDGSTGLNSTVATITLETSGVDDGDYDIALDTDGTYTLTAQAAGDGAGMVKVVVRDIVRGITKNIVR